MFNVGDFSYGISDIEKHIQILGSRFAETQVKQRRMLQKWIYSRDLMHKRTRWSNEELSEWQLEKIATLVDFAYSTNPFYNQLYKAAGYERGAIITWDDYNALPTISKGDIVEHFHMFKNNLSPTVEECLASRTSGSSGRSLTVFRDQTTIDYVTLLGMRFEEQMIGRRREPNEWLYLIYLSCYPYTSLDGQFPTFAVSIDCPSESILAHWKLLKPTVASGLPNSFLRMASIVQNPSELGVLAINVNSESSTQEERKIIADKFACPVFDEYSSVELSLIATQCRSGRYHITEDNVRVDVLNPDKNGMGEIIATNLANTYMPFIRYRQGDMIQINSTLHTQSDICECGSNFRVLDSFAGRADQFLHSRAIGVIPPDKVMQLYDRCLLSQGDFVDEFRIVQTHIDRLQVFLVPTAGASQANPQSVERFVRELKELFEDCNLVVNVENVSTMPPNKSHKRRLIINEMKDNG